MKELFFKMLILRSYLHTRYQLRFRDRSELKRYQHKRMKKLFSFLKRHSAYYRDNKLDLEGDGFSSLAIMDKKQMMEHFDHINTVGIRRDEAYELAIEAERTRDFTPTINDITIGLSSGTSGHRGLFIASPVERARYAGLILAKLLDGGIRSRERIGYFLRSDSNLYQGGKNKRLQFQYFDMIHPLKENIDKLNAYDPTLLLAPPSVLRELAFSKQRGELQISPHKIISIAEVLEPNDRQVIAQAFDQIVHQLYQCTEGFLGSTCREGTLHLSEDLIFFEKDFVDEWRFMPIITDFTRRSQPYVRYRMNDILKLRKEACPCGSPFTAIESIEGRADDVFYFPSLKHQGVDVPVYSDFIRRIVLFSRVPIESYQIKQKAKDRVDIILDQASCTPQAQQEIESQFQSLAQELSFQMPTLHFSHHFEVLGLNKLVRIKRLFPVGFDQKISSMDQGR